MTSTETGAEARAKAQSSRGLSREAWKYAARRTWHGFVRHRGLDSAG